jgi:signal transduction histidine kinase
LGELQLRLDWSRIDALLERAASGGRQVALLDAQGRLLAGSATVLKTLPRLRTELSPWVQDAASTVSRGAASQAALPSTARMLAGVGHASRVEGFEGFGWSLLVLMPRDEALVPVRAMAGVFAVLLAGVLGLVLLAAGHVSHRIARPIAALTAYTRQVRAGQPLPAPPPAASGEVGELREAYLRMVEDIGRSQQQLARASALAAVGEMSSVIAHEVRTPLGIVLSSAQIVRREPALSDEGRELLSFIESETERLGRLVSTMLETTRPRAPDIAPTDMGRVVTHAVALLNAQAARQNVSVETRLPGEPIHADCDDEQMTQVLLNLLLNGLQILKQGGRILVGLRREGDQVLIDIADDGPGIAPDARARIFEAFYFQREGGIGLGLAVVQRIVAAHGGEVEAGASELGGALFRVRLPLRQRVIDEERIEDV